MAQRLGDLVGSPSAGVERSSRGLAGLHVDQERHSQARRVQGFDFQQARLALHQLGWIEKKFDTKIVVDTSEYVAPTHKVDCYKNRVALEVEWNNKDHSSTAI